MASYNRVTLVGNLTRDPEMKTIASGLVIAEMGIAVNDRVKKGEQWVDEVCFVDLTSFSKTAEVCGRYLKKGSQVLIEGKLRLEQWDSKDGQKRSKHKVVVDKMVMLGSKNDSQDLGDGVPTKREQPVAQRRQEADDLTPF